MNRKKKILLYIERTFLNIFARFFLEFNVYYESPLSKGAKIFTPNHPTTSDPFLLSLVTEEPLVILVNKKILQIPIVGKIIEAAGTIPVDKEKKNGEEVIQQSRLHLQQGYPIGIFPEGRLSPSAIMLSELHTGAVRIAMTAHSPIIPVGIYVDPQHIQQYTTKRFPESRWLFHGKYYITVGKPLCFEGDVENRELVRKFTNETSLEIQRLMVISEQRAVQKGFAWNPIFPFASQLPR